MKGRDVARRRRRVWARAALGTLVAAVMMAGARLAFERQAAAVRAEKLEDLASVARMKVDAIGAWRSERLEDARFLSRSPFFAAAVRDLLRRPDDRGLLDAVNERLELSRDREYAAVLLLAADGRTLAGVPAGAPPPDTEERAAIGQALAAAAPQFCDVHRAAAGGEIRMDVVAAVAAVADGGGRPAAALLLRIDPHGALDPMIRSWPVYRRTAESLLVRREGDAVVFLNDLRFRPGAALRLRVPVSQARLPAARAVLGTVGAYEGRDYRGVEVLAQLQPVPDSPWFLVVKVDRDEILAGVRALAYRVAAFTVLLLLLAGLAAGFLYKHRGKRAFERLHRAERERREALEAFRTTLYSIGDAVITTDAAGRVNLLNPVAEALTGWREADAAGKPLPEVFRIVNEGTRATVENPVERVLREGTVVGLANHTMLIARDGCDRPIADSGAPIRDEDGHIVGVVLVFRDQTTERAAERALKEREFWLSESQRVARLGSYVLDFAAGVWTSSPMLDEIFGIDAGYPRTVEGWGAVVHPDHRRGMLDYLGHLVVTRGRFEREYKIVRVGDGAERWVAGLGELTFDASGVAVRMVGTIQDITERKAAEQRLDAGERRYRALFLAHPLPMWVYDLETLRFLAVNDAAVEKYGWSRAEFLAMTLRDIRPPEDVASLESSVDGSRTQPGFEASKGWRHRTRSGRVLDVEITSHDLVFEGRPGRAVVVHDVTERNSLEAQLRHAQKMEAVGTLAGGVAHDFNNLLQAMLSVAQAARLRTGEPDVARALTELESHVRTAATLTRQLLLFSRQETARREAVDVTAAVADGMAMLRRLLPETISLTVENAPAPLLTAADPGQVSQVLTNLVVNARDAMPEGGRLSVRTGRCGGDVVLEVEDTGSGMTPEVRERIFDPFFTTKGHGHGTGLGLAVVHGIVESHGGRIEVASEPGRGARFRVLLPAVEMAADAVKGAGVTADTLPTGSGQRILVVEDEDGARAGLEELLGLLRYSVTAVASGEDAAALPAEPAFDLLLTDLMLPGVSGLTAARDLCARWPRLKVVVMSGYAADALSRGELASGSVRFLQKPFDMTTLARELRAALTEL
ncbi:MAG: PAS domain S-box protein [Thermoanaerobaculaceae bacterium]|nr:PAS domain S-box protein [Thermoanaerobaculaceae bacterium]